MRDTFTPPETVCDFVGRIVSGGAVTAVIESLSKQAGAAIGSAVIRFPARYALDMTPDMGRGASLYIGGHLVFRGTVGSLPWEVDNSQDEMNAILFDDKWGMTAEIIGRVGIGTMPTTPGEGEIAGQYGFQDVGFDVCFNRDGMPNKDPDLLDFCTGPMADYWTIRDVIEFIFQWYIEEDVATCPAAEIDVLTQIPTDLNLVGQTPLQAIDRLMREAGQSWTLVPGSSASSLRRIAAGRGKEHQVRMARPKGGGNSGNMLPLHCSKASGGFNVQESRDVYQAVSGPIVVETTLTSMGETPMLQRQTSFKDPEYAARWAVDVEGYSRVGLGGDLSTWARPKPWLPHLVTRMKSDSSDYVSLADMQESPALQNNETVKKPSLWIAFDDDETHRKLVTGGVRIDSERCTIDFKSQIDYSDADGPTTGFPISDFSGIRIWFSVATVLERVEYAESEPATRYLPRHFYDVIRRDDLIPVRRYNLWLPDLTSTNPAAVVKIATGEAETYIAVADKLIASVAAVRASRPAIEQPLLLLFPLFPLVEVGDRVSLNGRDLGPSGGQIVTEVSYDVWDSFETTVRATNALGEMSPAKFLDV